MARIYVGCSLTHAPWTFVQTINRLKMRLEEEGHEVVHFLGLGVSTALDVYETDIHERLAECELFVAVCDLPSLGLGWELATSVEKFLKPTLAVAECRANVSRLPIGAAESARNPHFRFHRYKDVEDIIRLVKIYLAELKIV